jgi:hypothetical protein
VIDETSSLEDVCFEVAAALDRFAIEGVLTGGSAATVYAPDAYTSLDADFVLANSPDRKQLRDALADIGYIPMATTGMFKHPSTRFTIDFPRGPLAVGGDYVHETATLERGGIRLRILTPTDCVRDRLAHFYHWNDYTALTAAVAVAKSHRETVDIEQVRLWTERESGLGPTDYRGKFQNFLERLDHGPNAAIGRPE